MTLIRATAKAALLTLGHVRSSRSPHHHIGHDIGFAEVVVFLKRTKPEQYLELRGEDVLPSELISGFLPDAVTKVGNLARVIEFGGDYDSKRLQIIHDACQAKGVGYDIY